MFVMRYASLHDLDFWVSQDKHISREELARKIQGGQCYVIFDDSTLIGVLRYGLFWDNIPYLNLIHFEESYRKKGFGQAAMKYWEDEMRKYGHTVVLTSTQSDEGSQHFYRKLGYKDAGCLLLDVPPYVQPLEIIMIKKL